MKTTTCIVSLLMLLGCAKAPSYLDSREERPVCHMTYSAGDWWPQQLNIPMWLAYKDHIGWHDEDYWGYCKEEIVEIPKVYAYPKKDKDGKWIDKDRVDRIRTRRDSSEKRNRNQ